MNISLSLPNLYNSSDTVQNGAVVYRLGNQASSDSPYNYAQFSTPSTNFLTTITRILNIETNLGNITSAQSREIHLMKLLGMYVDTNASIVNEAESRRVVVEQRITNGFLLDLDLAGFTAATLAATETTQPLSLQHERIARQERKSSFGSESDEDIYAQQLMTEIYTRYKLLAREVAGGVSRIAGVAQTASELAEYAEQLGLDVIVSEGDRFSVYGTDISNMLLFARYVQLRFSKETDARGFKGLKTRIGLAQVTEGDPLIIYKDPKEILDTTSAEIRRKESHRIIHTVGGPAIINVESVQKKAIEGGIAIQRSLFNQIPALPILHDGTDDDVVHLDWNDELQGALGLLQPYKPKSEDHTLIREVISEMPVAYATLDVPEVNSDVIEQLLSAAHDSGLHCLKVVSTNKNTIPLILSGHTAKGILTNLIAFERKCRKMGISGVVCVSKGLMFQGVIARRADMIGRALNEASRGAHAVKEMREPTSTKGIDIIITEGMSEALVEEAYIPDTTDFLDLPAKGYPGNVRFYRYKGENTETNAPQLSMEGLTPAKMFIRLQFALTHSGYDTEDINEILNKIMVLAGETDTQPDPLLTGIVTNETVAARAFQLSTEQTLDYKLLTQVVLGILHNEKNISVTSILLKLNQYAPELYYPKRVIDERLSYNEREALRKLSAVTFGVDNYPLRWQTATALGIEESILHTLEMQGFVTIDKEGQTIKLNAPFASYFDERMPQDLREAVHGAITVRLLNEYIAMAGSQNDDSSLNYALLRSFALHYTYTGRNFLDRLREVDEENIKHLTNGLRSMFEIAWQKGKYIDIATVGLKVSETCSLNQEEKDDFLFKIAYAHIVLGNTDQAEIIMGKISNLSAQNQQELLLVSESGMRQFIESIREELLVRTASN